MWILMSNLALNKLLGVMIKVQYLNTEIPPLCEGILKND